MTGRVREGMPEEYVKNCLELPVWKMLDDYLEESTDKK